MARKHSTVSLSLRWTVDKGCQTFVCDDQTREELQQPCLAKIPFCAEDYNRLQNPEPDILKQQNASVSCKMILNLKSQHQHKTALPQHVLFGCSSRDQCTGAEKYK